MNQPDPKTIERAEFWLRNIDDDQMKKEIRKMIKDKPDELTECFYKDLEFGTGGLRGIMGPGPNRMNRYTVGMATQGLANYLKKSFPAAGRIKVAIAHDSRNNSPFFTQVAADVLSANGIETHLFTGLRPTPELSYAVRTLGCQSGIVITASHNPPEYNGYKVYWDDGAQIISPHDENIIHEVRRISSFDQVNFQRDKSLVVNISPELDDAYIAQIKALSLNPSLIIKHHDIPIVYTALHGTGGVLVKRVLNEMGFTAIETVDAQDKADGDFPTVQSPNPEEASALEMAINQAKESQAALVMATDPDADRVGLAVREPMGEFVLLNGNQAASLLIYYLLSEWKRLGKLSGNEFIVKTIVTTELIKTMAESFEVDHYDVLTGFKYIAQIIREKEGISKFIAGGEESYGYMIGDFVRDKDAIASCAMFAEITAWAAEQNKTLLDVLGDIYQEFGLYHEHLIAITKKGKSGAEEIRNIMSSLRSDPPATLGGSELVLMKDFMTQLSTNLKTGLTEAIDLPKSNVLQFFTAAGDKISARPSGTEPKIKFYFMAHAKIENGKNWRQDREQLMKRIDQMILDLSL